MVRHPAYAVQEKSLVKKEMANIFFLTQCLLMGDPATEGKGGGRKAEGFLISPWQGGCSASGCIEFALGAFNHLQLLQALRSILASGRNVSCFAAFLFSAP
jgi:hypothetical protein